MLPSLALSSSSLDQFRKNVYRPRLCLLLLLVLLSPYNTTQLASSDQAAPTTSISQPAQPSWAISIIDGLVVAAPPPAAQLLSAPPSTAAHKPDSPLQLQRSPASGAPGPSPAPSQSLAQQDEPPPSAQQGQPPPGSVFRLPKLSWGLLVDEHVLPALIILHFLWAIRLAGMAVEDGVVKNSLLGAKSRFYSVTLPMLYLGVLASLALIAGLPATMAAIGTKCLVWRGKHGFESLRSPESSQTFNFQADGLLPASLFVLLEMASTLVHLLSVLPKVDASPVSRILPGQLSLPSPSHMPPLVEMLPLPSFLKAALTESAATPSPSRYAGRRRPMMPPLRTPAPMPTDPTAAQGQPQQQRQQQQQQQQQQRTAGVGHAASSTAVVPLSNRSDVAGDATAQQTFRRVGAPEDEVIRSTSVARPIAPLVLADNDASQAQQAQQGSSPSASRRRRAPRLRGQSVLVSTKWLSDTATALFDKVMGTLIYAVITLRLPTLSPTSLPPVLSLLSLRSELATLTKIWTRARSSVECLEFVRRRWGVQLERGQDPYASVTRTRASAAAGDYKWKSYDDVYCAICFEMTRSNAAAEGAAELDAESDAGVQARRARRFEFCRLDCGHELHDVCLVSWLTAQAFCPTCHVVLSFSPRSSTRRSTAQT